MLNRPIRGSAITTASEKGLTLGLAAAGGHTDATLKMSSIRGSASASVSVTVGRGATTGRETTGTMWTMCIREMAAGRGRGRGRDTGTHGCIGMCPGCKMERLGGSFPLLVGLLTKSMRSVRGQIVRLLKDL